MNKFNVTYEIITPESAEHGDIEDCGFVAENISLRSAISLAFETESSHCDGIAAVEANEHPVIEPRWFTIYNGANYITGGTENRSLHIPDYVSGASRRRIARLIGCYGVK